MNSAAALILSLIFVTTTAQAVVFTASDSYNRSASATLTASGGTLTMVLTNTANVAATDNSYILTAVFLSLANGTTLAPLSISASGIDGSGTAVISDQWTYANPINYAGGNAGVSSTGLGGIFSAGDATFGGGSRAGGFGSPDYGIIPTAGFAGSNSLTTIRNSATFTFNLTGNLADIRVAGFQYGTAQSEPLVPVPETVPDSGSTLVLTAVGLLGVALASRNIRR